MYNAFEDIMEMIYNMHCVYTIEDENRRYYAISDTEEGVKELYEGMYNIEMYHFNSEGFTINKHRIDNIHFMRRIGIGIWKSVGIDIKTKWIENKYPKHYKAIDKLIIKMEEL